MQFRTTLKDADHEGAILRGADLSGADLSGADLGGADLGDIKYSSETVWPDGFEPPATGIIDVRP